MELHIPNGIATADRDRKEHYARVSTGLVLRFYCSWSGEAVAGKLTLLRKAEADPIRIEVKEVLNKFQELDPKDTGFETTLKDFMSQPRQHIKKEEQVLLPGLVDFIPASKSESLARSINSTKIVVPTGMVESSTSLLHRVCVKGAWVLCRSHPDAPDRPQFERAAGLMAAPVDHLIDVFCKISRGMRDSRRYT
jgi:hypothetical protein